MIVEWDLRKAEVNFKKHGISFEEAQSVLFAEASIEIEDRSHAEARFIIIGFSKLTRLLTVVYAYKDEDKIRIISARKATKKESYQYEKRV